MGQKDRLWARRSKLAGLLLLALVSACSGGPGEAEVATTWKPFDHGHTALDRVLGEHVRDGRVDYAALKADSGPLERYLDRLAAVPQAQYADWGRWQKLAFWINAYNAYHLKAIIEHYPIGRSLWADPFFQYPANSVRQIPGIWDDLTWPVAGRRLTLDHMEHVIMRRKLDEPRVHFVLVCASIGCPDLQSRAFEAEGLDSRLDKAAVRYIYQDNKVQMDREVGVVGLPRIFNWFGEDFPPLEDYARHFPDRPEGIKGPLTWIYRYARPEDRAFLRSGEFEVEWLPYDWGLNEQEG